MKTLKEIERIMLWLQECRSKDYDIKAYVMWGKMAQLQTLLKSELKKQNHNFHENKTNH